MSSNHFGFRQLVTLSLLASFGAVACGDADDASGGESTEKGAEAGGSSGSGNDSTGDTGGEMTAVAERALAASGVTGPDGQSEPSVSVVYRRSSPIEK